MSMGSGALWFDGALVEASEAKVSVLAHTLHYGMGAFEGIRAYEQPDGVPGIWRLDEHLRRLADTVKVLRLPWTRSVDEVREACFAVLAANQLRSAYLRPLVFLGAGQLGLGARSNPVHTIVAAWSWGAYLGEEKVRNGIRLKTSTFTRNHPNAALPRAKVVGHYVNSVLARYEANDDGYDEALMLDAQGLVAEGTGENVFAVHGRRIVTPPATNLLPGLTRASVIELLAEEGYTVQEAPIGRDALYLADEVFLTGTAAEITPVAELDRRPIGSGGRGPITARVQSLYADAVRGKIKSQRQHVARPTPLNVD